MSTNTRKRKIESASHGSSKRLKLTVVSGSSDGAEASATGDIMLAKNLAQAEDGDKVEMPSTLTDSGAPPRRRRINKLVPPRPFPTVPTSVSATGPRSAHKEGKNYICLTRKTPLGAYMRRCKDVIIKDGYKTLYMTAMGAAIPLLLQLTAALPPILPFPANEIHTDVTTGTVEVLDEIISEDEDEDITYQTRGKSTLKIIMKIGSGEFEGDRIGPTKKNNRKRGGNDNAQGGSRQKAKPVLQDSSEDVVFQEPEQEEML